MPTWPSSAWRTQKNGYTPSAGKVKLYSLGVPGPASADNIVNDPWEIYQTTVASIEAATGYTFLSALPDWIQPIVKNNDSRPVAHAGGPYSGVAGVTLTFDGGASFDPDPDDVLTFEWHVGDGGTASGVQPSYSYDLPGAYTAMLVVADRWGWADTAFAAVAIDEPAPTAGQARRIPQICRAARRSRAGSIMPNSSASAPSAAAIGSSGTGSITRRSTWSSTSFRRVMLEPAARTAHPTRALGHRCATLRRRSCGARARIGGATTSH